MKAVLNTYRQSPRKVRLIADLIRGKKVDFAMNTLKFTDKTAAGVIEKLLKSAVDNAKTNFNIEKENLVIKEITVNQGATLKRRRPRARGSAFPINKRTSHISVVLESK
jgi:large subunit ribosomal protein L22